MGQRQIWDEGVGDAWVRHAAVIDAHGAPFGDAARHALGPLQGARVLDVGCGAGTTTRELVAHGAAQAVGIDLSAPVIALARRHAEGIGGVHFVVGDATALPMAAPFDAIYSRFGVMFFDDAVAAFAGLREQVVEGGRLAFAAWAGPFDNPWLTAPVLASIPVLGPPELPGPTEPGPFSLGEPEHVVAVLEAAGWREVLVDRCSTTEPHPAGGIDEVATLVIENAPPLALGLARHPSRAAELHAAVVEGLRPYEVDGAVCAPASALIVSARR